MRAERDERQDAEPSAPVLRRSRRDRVVADLLGGLGRHLGVDPLILRIAAVVLVLLEWKVGLLYLVGWIAIPEERGGEPAVARATPESVRWIFGLGLIAFGLVLLARVVFPWVDHRLFAPLALIATGALLIASGRQRGDLR